MMEIERLKTLKAEEERERLRLEAQRRGAAVIIDQIKEREIQRIAEKEQRTKAPWWEVGSLPEVVA